MSSAAVQQTTPQQYQQSPASRDRYPAALSSSPPSSRRTGRQSSGNAALPNTPQQVQYTTSPGSSAPMTTPRGHAATHASPSEPMSNSTYEQFYPDSATSAALPIRTSTQQTPSSGTAAAYDNRAYGSRSQQQSTGYSSENERERASENDRRQRTQKSSRDDPGSASRSQRSRHAPTQSRSATAVGQTPVDTSLPRENSAIINHIVVDDPQSDLARERARVAEAQPHQVGTQPGMVDQSTATDTDHKHRSRQEHLRQSTHRKEVKFGDYILGQTLGEGEFGKVKMGWKKDSSVQVAIKLIRKESLQSNASRLPKIYREISILRELQHPNIVRLHEFVETERHMGIILEYASGGELFDYILNHRYLKDPAARRLFAQLVSGVGYLHKKGIVHRDLKLENLLLDRNRNIIITDFGFANTFNPNDELGEELEHRISDKEFVKRERLAEPDEVTGFRKGDLMQTSCGSPCYAAPELVVSDGLYTGRKVDVWSCGVILYAMLAGYLPFDDDPANPEGDNINLLYKYIVSTPLTFPEYVTPHARDLLRRILVPEPRRRADLFEVARHSWLSEYSHVVGFIGSSTKSDRDIASSAMQQDSEPALGRSASVREPTTRSPAAMSAGGVQKQTANVGDAEAKSRDAKRRTVQLEYVAPKDATARGETSPTAAQGPAGPASGGRTRARGDAAGPVEVSPSARREVQAPQIPRKEAPSMPPPARPSRDQARAVSDSTAFTSQPTTSQSRPNTSGTLGSARLPSRGNSYSQPAVATSTPTNAQGHFSQPKSSSGYIISGPMQSSEGVAADDNRPVSQQNLAQFQQQQQQQLRLQQEKQQKSSQRSHKRSSTLGSIGDRILGRSNSRRQSQQQEASAPAAANEKKDRKYPPVSMRNNIPNSEDASQQQQSQPRTSTDSRRPSFGFSRKNSDAPSGESRRSSRRFSFLPASFSMNNFTGAKKDSGYDDRERRPESKGMAFGRGASRSPSRSTTGSTIPLYYEADREAGRNQRRSVQTQQQQPQPQSQGRDAARYEKLLPPQPATAAGTASYPSPPPIQRTRYRDDGYGGNLLEPSSRSQQQQQEPVERFYTPAETLDQAQSPNHQSSSQAAAGGYNNYPTSAGGRAQQQYSSPLSQQQQAPPSSSGGGGGGAAYSPNATGGYSSNAYGQTAPLDSSLRPSQRKFEYDHGHGGSSSATRRVMDFFRRRGKDRGEV